MPAKPNIDYSFSIRPYVRSLSYREFLTCSSIALLQIAAFDAIDYSSDNDWTIFNVSLVKTLSFFIFIFLNHIFYKLEHKRANNFIGRNIHDYIFVLLVFAMSKIKLLMAGNDVTISVNGIGSAIAMTITAVFLIG